MNPLRNILVLSIALFLSLGIGAAYLHPEFLLEAIVILFLSITYTSIILYLNFKRSSYHFGIRYSLLLSTFLLGYLLYSIHLPTYQKNHIEHLSIGNKEAVIHLKVIENLRSTSYYHQYIVEAMQVNNNIVKGKILLRSPIKDSIKLWEPGQEKLVYTAIQSIPEPLNPYDIDLRSYYHSLGIYHHTTLDKSQVIEDIPSQTKLSWRLRKKTLSALKPIALHENSKQLIQAMVLGYRNEWSNERRTQYSNAGVAHILAISGLHVGILYLALFWLVLPLQRIARSRTPVYLFCLLGLWFYAWFTGMSPSVTRSVSMLSFFIIAKIWNRPAPSLHTLGSSYIVLLLIKPQWLFHIGFQMSYTAVFFILWLYPKVNPLWHPKHIIVRRIWQMLLITCIAQLGVLPWTVHYFGKIPGLFLISNLIVLTFVSILLIGGILILLLGVFGIYNGWHIRLYDFLTLQIDNYIQWVATQESWILSVNKPNMMICLGLFIMFLVLLPVFWQRDYPKLRNLAIGTLVFLSIVIFTNIKGAKEEIWLVQQVGESIILQTNPKEVYLYTNQDKIDTTYLWKQLHTNYPKHSLHKNKLPKYFTIDRQNYLHIDSTTVYSNTISPGAIIILQQSTRVNLERLINDLNPSMIIADGSNYPSAVEPWKQTCIKTKTPFVYTREKGALLLATNSAFRNLEMFLEKKSDNLSTLPQN